MVKRIQTAFHRLQVYAAHPWFVYLLGSLAVVDNFIFIIPMVPILIGAILTVPKKWFSFATWTILGNTLGATLFSGAISIFGISFVERVAPYLFQMKAWEMSREWVEKYGLSALFLNSVLPTIDHPMIALLTLAAKPLYQIALILLAAKSVKYYALSWFASKAPHLLHRLKIVVDHKH